MTVRIQVQTDYASLQHFLTATSEEAVWRAGLKAGNDTLRNLRTEAGRRVRAQRRLKAKRVREALRLFPANSRKGARVRLRWRMGVSGKPVPLYAYGARETKRGVSVNVSGRRKIVGGAFIATMPSGHTGVFERRHEHRRLPIDELFSSRVSDVFQDTGFLPKISTWAQERFGEHWRRLVPVEIDRAKQRALRKARSRR